MKIRSSIEGLHSFTFRVNRVIDCFVICALVFKLFFILYISQITRVVIWGETYSDIRVDDAKSGELPNQTLVS